MILDGNDPQAIAAAARAVRSGALLGLPTETVYGLAADASSDAAVAQIFAAKGRPSDHPLIVHVANAEGIAHFARDVPAFAQKLVDAFWPGPLTVILPRLPGVATGATGGQDSVGLRRARRQPRTGRPARVGRGGPQRQPLWPREPHHRPARAGRAGR
jgi:L-threonylcarbamoyladenylate synthase